jgi:signal transduction histidine kinase
VTQAYGEPVGDEPGPWEVAAQALTPDKSLARIDARAQQVVGTISLVGVALTGLGLVSGSLLDRQPVARWLALAAAAIALAAVVLALSASVLRIEREMTTSDLAEVKAFYRRQFKRAKVVRLGGWLLLCAVALAALAAAIVVASGPSSTPMISIVQTGSGADAKLSISAEFANVRPGDLLTTEVTGDSTRLARSITRAGASRTATIVLDVPNAGGYRLVTVTAAFRGARCTATLSSRPSEPDTASC